MANYSYNPTGMRGNVVDKASPTSLSGKLKSSIAGPTTPQLRMGMGRAGSMTQPDKNLLSPSTGISPAKGGSYSQMFAELIPDVNFNKITLTGGAGRAPLQVRVNVTLRDIIEGDSISNWFANTLEDDPTSSPFEKYLKLNIIQCTNADVCEVLSGRQKASYLVDKGVSGAKALEYVVNRSINLDAKINSPSDDSKSIQEYRRIMPGGEEIIEIPMEERFTVNVTESGEIVQHLSYFVYITMDVEKMANDFNMDIEYFKRAQPTTSVYSEYVIQNGNVVSDTNIFLLPSGEIWEGETHYHDPAINPDPRDPSFKGYMTGRFHRPDSQYLEVKVIPNSKIRDFRYVNRVEDRYRSVTQARVGAGLVEGEATVGEAVEEDIISQSVTRHTKLIGKEIRPDKKSSPLSDLWTSIDESYNGNGMFAFDYIGFLKENSAYPYLWSISQETNLKLLSLANIAKIQLRRRQVDPKEKSNNRLGTPDKPKIKKGYPYRVLATSSQSRRSNLIRTIDNSSCYFTETKVDIYGSSELRADGIRWFTFTDRSLMFERNGTFQYSVEITSTDPTAILMRISLATLLFARRMLGRYLAESISYTNNKPNFDIYVDRFIPEFITRMNSEQGRAMWKRPAELYIKNLRTLSTVLNQPAYPGSSYTLETVLPQTLSSYLDPFKGSPEGIQTVISMVDALIQELQNKVGTVSMGATRQARKNTSSAISPKIKTSRGVRFLRKDYVFGCGQELVLDGYRGKGYDYLTNQTLDFVQQSIKGKGMRALTSRYYKKRCEIETRRYFTIAAKDGVTSQNFDLLNILGRMHPDLNLSSEDPRDSLVNQKFSFLTPSFVFQSRGRSVAGYGGGSSPPPASTKAVAVSTSGPSHAQAGSKSDLMVGSSTVINQASQTSDNSLTYKYNKPMSTKPHSATQATTERGTPIYATVSTNPNMPGYDPMAKGSAQMQAYSMEKQSIVSAAKSTYNTPVDAPKNEEQEAVIMGIQSVQANIIAAQQNPDFSLFPISVKGYQPPGQSMLSQQQQAMKKQYMELLASRVQVVDAGSEFYLDSPFLTKKNATSFGVDDSNPSDESVNEPKGPDYENVDHVDDVSSQKLLPIQKVQPIMPVAIRNINPTPLLQALGNISFGYYPGGPRGPMSYGSFHISNFQQLNFSDSSTPNILDDVNPSNKITALKALPNQLKSLVLSTSDFVQLNAFRVPSRDVPSENSPPIDGVPWLFRPENMPKIWQMFQNIVSIEYLYSFQTPIMERRDSSGFVKAAGERDLLKAPIWLQLNRGIIDRLEEGDRKVSLLCRIKKYRNGKLGIGYHDRKDLPVIDKYFTLVIDPYEQPDLGRLDAVTDGELEGEQDIQMSTSSANTSGANSNLVSTDSTELNNFLAPSFIRRIDPETGDEVTVQEFDGNLVVSNNCDEGGS